MFPQAEKHRSCSYVIILTGDSYRTLFRPGKALEKEVVTV